MPLKLAWPVALWVNLLSRYLIQARTYLERALEEYVPARDTQARFRFGHDPGAAAAAYLALAAWHLGEVGARSAIGRTGGPIGRRIGSRSDQRQCACSPNAS